MSKNPLRTLGYTVHAHIYSFILVPELEGKKCIQALKIFPSSYCVSSQLISKFMQERPGPPTVVTGSTSVLNGMRCSILSKIAGFNLGLVLRLS